MTGQDACSRSTCPILVLILCLFHALVALTTNSDSPLYSFMLQAFTVAVAVLAVAVSIAAAVVVAVVITLFHLLNNVFVQLIVVVVVVVIVLICSV